MSVLLGADETPLVPSSIVDELKALNPRLGLEYHPTLQSFVLMLDWEPNDERWRLVQGGALNPKSAKSMLCNVPADVPLDELRGWVSARLRQVAQSREDIRRMVEDEEARIAKANAATQAANEAAALEAVTTETMSGKTINVGNRRTRVK